MATGSWPTLLDVASRTDGKGNIPHVAEMLSQENTMYQDMPFVEANERTGHLFVYRTSIPAGSWRAYNQGVPQSKSTTAKSRVGIGMLADYSIVDRALARHTGDVEKFRYTEDVAFLEGMGQTIQQTVIYGNTASQPASFQGLATFYNTINTSNQANAANVIDGGGTGSSNCSLWMLGWSPRTIYAIYPSGSTSGLIMENKGDVRAAYDNLGNPYEAYTGYFEHQMAIVPEDWRYGARIANIDTTSAGLAGANALDIFATMAEMQFLFPKLTGTTSGITKSDAPDDEATGVRTVFYANRTLLHWMQVQAMRDRNVLARQEDYAGIVTDSWRGLPIKCQDQLTNTESRVT